MKKCGNCNLNYNSKENKCCCAYDNQYRPSDYIGCSKWSEYSSDLSPQDRRDIASSNNHDDLTRDANELAREAIIVAREANEIARSEAASAARSARWAKIAAIIAAIAAIIGPIITAWLAKK